MSDIKIEWDEDWHPGDLKDNLEALIRADETVKGLADRPWDLWSHHVFTNSILSLSEPYVFVYGKEGSDKFHCRWDSTGGVGALR